MNKTEDISNWLRDMCLRIAPQGLPWKTYQVYQTCLWYAKFAKTKRYSSKVSFRLVLLKIVFLCLPHLFDHVVLSLPLPGGEAQDQFYRRLQLPTNGCHHSDWSSLTNRSSLKKVLCHQQSLKSTNFILIHNHRNWSFRKNWNVQVINLEKKRKRSALVYKLKFRFATISEWKHI